MTNFYVSQNCENMIDKKKIKLLIISVFWIAIYLLYKSQRLNQERDPIIMLIIGLALLGNLWYHGIYKKNKLKKKCEELKAKRLSDLKKKIDNYTLKVDPNKLPKELAVHTGLFEKWGIDNNLLRNDLLEKSTKEELYKLKAIEKDRELIDQWIIENDDSSESKALKLTVKAYDDLGLWTWK